MSAVAQSSASPAAAPPKRKRGRPLGSRNAPKPSASSSPSTAPPTFTFDTGVSLLLTAIALPITAAMSAYAETLSQQLQASTSTTPQPKRQKRSPAPPAPLPPPPSTLSTSALSQALEGLSQPMLLTTTARYIVVPRSRPAGEGKARRAKTATTPLTPVPRSAPHAVDDSETEDEDDGLPVAFVGPSHPPHNPAMEPSPRRTSPRQSIPSTPASAQGKKAAKTK